MKELYLSDSSRNGRRPQEHLLSPKPLISLNLLIWIFSEIPLFWYVRVALVDAMNFNSWPDEFRPTELKGSSKEVLDFSLPLPLTLPRPNQKYEIFSPKKYDFSNLIFNLKDLAYIAPHVNDLFGSVYTSKRLILSRFKFKLFYMNFI